MDALDELRRLLLRREQEHLREIDERLGDRARRARDVAGVLPQAVTLSREAGNDALGRALQPAVEGSIRESLEQRPQVFVEAFHPIIGALVRRSVAESLRGLLQGLNQTLEHAFSPQGLRWRWEAWRTGRPFAEVVMLRSLVYRVEQLFLIHRETSLSLLHVAAAAVGARNSDMVAGMLSAIQNFARDSFETGVDSALEEFRVGELQVWIAPGRHAYLAAVIRGNPARELRVALEETVENVHVLRAAELAHFGGDPAAFEGLRPDLEACLRAQYQPAPRGPGKVLWARLALLNVAVVGLAAGLLAWRSAARWGDFLRRLEAEPGVALTGAEHRWRGPSRVRGLRDPLAANPAPLASAAGVDPAGVRFDWKPFLALDPVSVRRRFEHRFGSPPDARVTVRDDGPTVEVAGAVPYEWLERVRREAALVPGVVALAERDLRVTHDPALVRARFTAAYPPPPEVQVRVEGGALVLSGRAPYEWLAAVRAGAGRLPGVAEVVERDLAVAFDPAGVRRRFEERFGLPDTVTLAVGENGAVALGGEAAHAWLQRVRQNTADLPGVGPVDDRGVTDLDQQTFQQAKSVVESAYVYFLPGKENFATEGFTALSRLPDEVRRLAAAARRLGQPIGIEIHGSADNTGPEAKNLDLSQRRAGAVRDFLVSCGFDAALFQTLGLGAPPAGTGEKPTAEATQRRVAFRVVSRTISARP